MPRQIITPATPGLFLLGPIIIGHASAARRAPHRPEFAALAAHPDLARLAAAWPLLPPALRSGILAMVKASTPQASQMA